MHPDDATHIGYEDCVEPTLVAEPVTCETPIALLATAPSIAAAFVQPAHDESTKAAKCMGGALSRVRRSSKLVRSDFAGFGIGRAGSASMAACTRASREFIGPTFLERGADLRLALSLGPRAVNGE